MLLKNKQSNYDQMKGLKVSGHFEIQDGRHFNFFFLFFFRKCKLVYVCLAYIQEITVHKEIRNTFVSTFTI